MQAKMGIQELNKAMDSLAPNIYFLSLMIGNIEIPSDYKYDVQESVEFIQRYYELKQSIEEAGFHAQLGSDLDAEECYWEFYIEFGKQWNEVIRLLKPFLKRKSKVENTGFAFCRKLFSLPGGHYSEPCISLSENLSCNPIWHKEQKDAINEAILKNEAITNHYTVNFSRYEYDEIINKMFEVKRMISSFEAYSDFDFIEEYITEIREWLRHHIDIKERIGSFRIIEYGEELFDRIEELYFEDFEEVEIRRLAHDFEHLIFRVVAYFGDEFSDVLDFYREATEE